MKENTDNRLIEDYIDGLLKGKELAGFQQRLETDAEFSKAYNLRIRLAGLWQEADEYQQTKKQVREVMDAEKKSGFLNHRKTYYLLAIAASIVVLLGVYWLFDSRVKNMKNQMAETADTIELQMDKPDILAEIKYNFQLLSPENKQSFKVGDTIEFRWDSPVDTLRIELLIKDRTNNELVFRTTDYSKNHYRLATENLSPGEYVWSVQDTANRRFFTIK